MSSEPAFSAAAGGSLDIEPILDVLPVPMILVEPGTARILYANARRAQARGRGVDARRSGGGLSARLPALRHHRAGAGVGRDAGGPRGARGETHHLQVDWDTPDGLRTVLVSGSTIELGGGRQVTVVTFEDVTQLEGRGDARAWSPTNCE